MPDLWRDVPDRESRSLLGLVVRTDRRYRWRVLLRKEGDAVIAIGQASHAWISGQLARAWGNALFAAPDPFEEVCLAAEQHDVGMAEWDLRASLNPRTGLPYSFLEIPLQTHLALWTAAPAKLSLRADTRLCWCRCTGPL